MRIRSSYISTGEEVFERRHYQLARLEYLVYAVGALADDYRLAVRGVLTVYLLRHALGHYGGQYQLVVIRAQFNLPVNAGQLGEYSPLEVGLPYVVDSHRQLLILPVAVVVVGRQAVAAPCRNDLAHQVYRRIAPAAVPAAGRTHRYPVELLHPLVPLQRVGRRRACRARQAVEHLEKTTQRYEEHH